MSTVKHKYLTTRARGKLRTKKSAENGTKEHNTWVLPSRGKLQSHLNGRVYKCKFPLVIPPHSRPSVVRTLAPDP